jgi:hypothetical protein
MSRWIITGLIVSQANQIVTKETNKHEKNKNLFIRFNDPDVDTGW